MRKLLFAAAAAAALVAAVPASAQIYLGADPGGAGVQVGPFGFGVGPRYDWRDRDEYYAYGADCPLVPTSTAKREWPRGIPGPFC